MITLCAVAGFGTGVAHAQVMITEIMYNPKGVDKGGEWVEILNDGNAAVSIENIRFFEADTNHKIRESIGGTEIPAGDMAIIAQDSALFKDAYKSYQGPIFISSFNLRQMNGIGEPLGIYNVATEQMDSQIAYIPDERTNGTGASLHLTLGGTQVPAPATPGEIAINPITVQNAVIEKPQEQEEVEERPAKHSMSIKQERPKQQDIVALVQSTLNDGVDAQREKMAPITTVVDKQKDYTRQLWLIALLLGVIVIELWLIYRATTTRNRRTRGMP